MVRFGKLKNAAVGFDVLTTCQPSTVWCSRERLPAVAPQPAKVHQSCSATDYYYYYYYYALNLIHVALSLNYQRFPNLRIVL
jgi:hypothetical protein